MTDSRSLNEMCSLTICVDSYDKKAMRGRICSSYYEEAIRFNGLVDLATTITAMLDRFEYPQNSIELRYMSEDAQKQNLQLFCERHLLLGKPRIVKEKGELNTFSVKILFRKHATWQGSISSIKEKKEINFRSFLEMILIMDSSLTDAKYTNELKE